MAKTRSNLQRKGRSRPRRSSRLAKKKTKCEVCTKIVSAFRSMGDKDIMHPLLKLGSFKEVLITTTCDVHPRMFEFYSGTKMDKYEHGGISHFWAQPSHVYPGLMIWGTASDTLGRPAIFISTTLYLLLSAYTINQSINLKVLHPHWIDSNLFRRWKRGCDSRQKRDCQMGVLATGRLAPARPAWLLDTWRLCLVPGAVNVPYVALSYVWGKRLFFKTLKKNIAQLQNDQAFSDCHNRLGVPRTIADAISVVGLLDERYLWVDALCIVQDDESTRHDQLNNMASIFASATVTIIAQQGSDANYGLRGLRGISQPRNLLQESFRLAKGYQVAEHRTSLRAPSIWSRRGWTCQEELFSKRTLVFAADTVEWRCACSSCPEELRQSKSYRNLSGLNTLSNLFSSPVPDLVGYGRLVQDYNKRELTHPEDVLAAFAGITTALSQTFYGGFICGLPSLFFDIALCWAPVSTCKRMVPSCSSEAAMAGLPSWSWAGWEGYINISIWAAGCDYIKNPQDVVGSTSSLRIVSTVQWYCQPWGTKESRPIQGPEEIRAWKALVTDDRQDLPAGWTRLEYTPDEDEYQQSVHNLDRAASTISHYYYKHESDPTTEFWYPIPLCEGLQAPPSRHSETLINCRTQRSWLYIANHVFHIYGPTDSLHNTEGAWVGVIRLHDELESGLNNSTCEFVEISRGYVIEGDSSAMIEEWKIPDRPKLPGGEIYEFINVLWIEWEEGIAYRKAYGRVMKSAWEAQELEWIDLVLG